MSIPTIILTKERPSQLSDMLKSMQGKVDDKDVIIIDNASTDPRMMALLDSISGTYRVLRQPTNAGFVSINKGLELVEEDFFAISDPDIIFNPLLPDGWDEIMISGMVRCNVPKIGFALDTACLPDTPKHNRIRVCETYPIISKTDIGTPDDAWIAYLDTTYAIYRKDTYDAWEKEKPKYEGCLLSPEGLVSQDHYSLKYGRYPIRVGGRFMARHTGWTMQEDYLEDYEYYKKNCNLDWASTTKLFKGMGA